MQLRPVICSIVLFALVGCVPPTATSTQGKIALLLPETKTTRYESHDLPIFRAQLAARGFNVDRDLIYSNATQDAAAQQQQAAPEAAMDPETVLKARQSEIELQMKLQHVHVYLKN